MRRPRRNIAAGEPVKLRVRALDVFVRPLFARGWFPGMGAIVTIGRRSGKQRRHAVRLVRKGARIYLVVINGPHANWLWNLRTSPRVRVELAGESIEGTARELAAGPERDAARAIYVGTVNPADYIECFIHWRGWPARWKIERLHGMWFDGGVPLVVDLDAPRAPGGAGRPASAHW